MIFRRFLSWSHLLAMVVVLAGLLAVMVPGSVVRADSVVTFPDGGLEAAIRKAISKPTGDIYQSDLDDLGQLYASAAGIADLTGLEHCTGLSWLELNGNQIADLEPLANLSKLDNLYLDRNQIVNLEPLANLSNLAVLNLMDNRIGDLEPLGGLTVEYLSLNDNQISDISPLAGVTTLRGLALGENQISDISTLSGLTDLWIINLSYNQISDIKPLVDNGITGLGDEYINLRGNPLNSTSINTYIPILLARGVMVDYDALPAPTLLSPANGSTTCDRTPYLDWTKVSAATAVHYQLQVDNNADFSSPMVSKTWVSYSYYTVTSSLSYGSTYYWRVRSVDGTGNKCAWTAPWSFKVARTGPPAPGLLSPADGSSSSHHTPYLDWTKVTGCSAVHYQVQVDNNADFSSPVVKKTWVSYSYYHVTTSLLHGEYWWRVRAVDASGNTSPWSYGPGDTWSFTIL